MGRKAGKRLLFRCLTAVLLLGLWQIAALFFPPLVVPPVSRVASRLVQIITGNQFLPLVGTTLLRLLAGLGIGVVLGTGIGLVFGLCKPLEEVFSPFVSIFQTVPPVCWVVLALVWFGFNGKPCVFIVATAAIPAMVINLSSGVRSIDPELIEMAHMYRFSRRKILFHVILPSIRPYFRSALEIVIGSGWKLVVMGEVLTTSTGIGGAITTARLNIEPDSIIAWALLLVLFCFLTQAFLRFLFCRKGGSRC